VLVAPGGDHSGIDEQRGASRRGDASATLQRPVRTSLTAHWRTPPSSWFPSSPLPRPR